MSLFYGSVCNNKNTLATEPSWWFRYVAATEPSGVCADAVDAGTVILNKISVFVPHVLLADYKKISFYKSIESKVSLPPCCIQNETVWLYYSLSTSSYDILLATGCEKCSDGMIQP